MRRLGTAPRPGDLAFGHGGRSRATILMGLALLMCALGIGAGIGAGFERFVPGATPPAPPTSNTSASSVPGTGPRGTFEGIPVGYAHTAQGAAQAVGNYLAALGGRLALDSTAAAAALDHVADPADRSALERGQAASLQVDEGLWGVETAFRQGKQVVLTQTPIAYRVATYSPQKASVQLWLVTTVGVEDRQRLAAFFGNASATVTWLDGDWRLQSIDAGSASGDVIPACLQTPTPTGGVPAKLEGFVSYGG
jgi:hypothetical protein